MIKYTTAGRGGLALYEIRLEWLLTPTGILNMTNPTFILLDALSHTQRVNLIKQSPTETPSLGCPCFPEADSRRNNNFIQPSRSKAGHGSQSLAPVELNDSTSLEKRGHREIFPPAEYPIKSDIKKLSNFWLIDWYGLLSDKAKWRQEVSRVGSSRD